MRFKNTMTIALHFGYQAGGAFLRSGEVSKNLPDEILDDPDFLADCRAKRVELVEGVEAGKALKPEPAVKEPRPAVAPDPMLAMELTDEKELAIVAPGAPPPPPPHEENAPLDRYKSSTSAEVMKAKKKTEVNVLVEELKSHLSFMNDEGKRTYLETVISTNTNPDVVKAAKDVFAKLPEPKPKPPKESPQEFKPESAAPERPLDKQMVLDKDKTPVDIFNNVQTMRKPALMGLALRMHLPVNIGMTEKRLREIILEAKPADQK